MHLQIFYHIKALADKWQDAFKEFPGVCVGGGRNEGQWGQKENIWTTFNNKDKVNLNKKKQSDWNTVKIFEDAYLITLKCWKLLSY